MDETFLREGNSFFHNKCWETHHANLVNNLLKPQIAKIKEEIGNHRKFLRLFAIYVIFIIIAFIASIIFYNPTQFFSVIIAFLLLCALIATPFLLIKVARTIAGKKKKLKKFLAGEVF